MKKEKQRSLWIALSLLALFLLWTLALCIVDVAPVGPSGSKVGFATINQFVHRLTGVHMALYTLTDWLSLAPIAFVVGFALLGLIQWIKRGSLLKVDHSLFVLGAFYLVTFGTFIFFETFALNFRPILINGVLETSYPSSTTLLVMCVMPTAFMQLRSRLQNHIVKGGITCAILAFTVFMVIGRLLSGVHWFTDIVGGALFSTGLVLLYYTFADN